MKKREKLNNFKDHVTFQKVIYAETWKLNKEIKDSKGSVIRDIKCEKKSYSDWAYRVCNIISYCLV